MASSAQKPIGTRPIDLSDLQTRPNLPLPSLDVFTFETHESLWRVRIALHYEEARVKLQAPLVVNFHSEAGALQYLDQVATWKLKEVGNNVVKKLRGKYVWVIEWKEVVKGFELVASWRMIIENIVIRSLKPGQVYKIANNDGWEDSNRDNDWIKLGDMEADADWDLIEKPGNQ